MVLFLLILFILLVGGGWFVGKFIGGILFPTNEKTYIDKSVHHHHYHNTTVHNHEHKSISIIDDETKRKIFELKESQNKKAT